jgi:type IV pilus assembly protein PilW
MKQRQGAGGRYALGFSLIELMVAMVLGLLVVGAAIGIFLSNRQTYAATESLGRVQEGVRTAFELMSRDLREAAGNPCVNNLPIANVLNNSTANWWSDLSQWGQAFQGYAAEDTVPGLTTGTGSAQRVVNTEALQLFTANDNVATVASHNTGGATLTVNSATHGLVVGDLAVVCNARQASVFQVSSVAGAVIGHAASGTPGNCTTRLGLPMNCAAGTIFAYTASNSVVVRLRASRWYIGNGANGPALYQQVATTAGTVTAQEVADGIEGLSVLYLVEGQSAYQEPSAIAAADWAKVTAARITLTLEGNARVGTAGEAITRQLIHVVSLRNRNP